MFWPFHDYNRRQLKAIRRELRAVTSVVDRVFGGDPPDDLLSALGGLSRNLTRFEQEIGASADIVFRTSLLRMCSIELRREIGRVEQWRRSRRFPWERSPLERVFDALDRLDIATYGLYGPSTEFQRRLRKLVQKSALTVYRLAQLAEVDEAYLRRLAAGEKRNPRQDVVIALAMALREGSSSVSARDIQRLIRSASYRPPSRRELDDYHAADSA